MMMQMMIASMIARVSNLSRKGRDDDNKEVGDDYDVKVPVQERPALPHLEEEGASDDVDDDKQDGE